jgi:hypothetical protein
MIKLFRNIRKNLLNEGKTSKYFKYAIGEIVLVVIGILIALQINTWNQEHKERNAEKAMIADLKTSLLNTKTQLEDLTLRYERNLEQVNLVVDHIKSRRPLDDQLKRSLINIESYPEPLFEIGIYENFKINSLHLIQNDSLKTAIIQFYEAQLPSISDKLTNNIESISTTSLIPLNVQNFSYGDGGKMTPNDYEDLLDNQQYFNAITYMRGIKGFALSEIQRVLKTVKLLIDDVATYQNQLE